MPACIICFEEVTKTFQANERCRHHVCWSCLGHYLLTYMESLHAQYTTVPCPENSCRQSYQIDRIHTMGIFNGADLDDWWRTLLERTCFETKGTCPYPDCNALFELYDESGGHEEDDYGECYECYRPICLICESQWHPAKPCDNKRRFWKRSTPEWKIRRPARENSILVRQVAQKNGWTQCPKCKEMVMRSIGCNTMWCRCGVEFCYRCGGPSKDHNCKRNCHNLSASKLEDLRATMYAYPDKPEQGLPSLSK